MPLLFMLHYFLIFWLLFFLSDSNRSFFFLRYVLVWLFNIRRVQRSIRVEWLFRQRKLFLFFIDDNVFICPPTLGDLLSLHIFQFLVTILVSYYWLLHIRYCFIILNSNFLLCYRLLIDHINFLMRCFILLVRVFFELPHSVNFIIWGLLRTSPSHPCSQRIVNSQTNHLV